ncbi:hypothetical protein [Pandoraea sp. CB10b_02]|uniref:phage protein n=1 Tax=Pandoraea sp. CB10b_02 TaxID=2014535 RepID=UPI00257F00C2|nr:hypothetical protein [Pandoraea sp. CB10b_02]
MTTQYLRKASLIVGDDTGDALDFSEFRIVFQVRRGDVQTPNSALIKVYNVAPNTAAKALKDYTRVRLSAGYGAIPGLIFDGIIKQSWVGRESATDTFLAISAASGDAWYNNAVISKTFAAGSTVADHILAVTETLPKYGLSVGYIPEFQSNPLPRGQVFFGMARNAMRNIAQNLGADWSIQDTKFQIVPKDSFIPSEVVEVNSDSGMVGTPTQTQNGVDVLTLLNSNLRVSTLIKLDNDSIQRYQYGLSVADTESNSNAKYFGRLNSSGYYKILTCDHTGDTLGGPWYSSLKCISADLTTAPQFIRNKSVAGPGAVKPWG